MLPDVFISPCEPPYDGDFLKSDNRICVALQRIWTAMGLDATNPFRDLLPQGGTAVIKPNWVSHGGVNGCTLDCLVTHSALIACLINCCATAMNGEGVVVVGDAPIQGCDFETLLTATGFRNIIDVFGQLYPKIDFQIQDWRLTVLPQYSSSGVLQSKQDYRDSQKTLEDNYLELDLGKQSFLEDIVDYSDRFRVAMYRPSLMQRHHGPGKHQYLFRKEPLAANLLINVAKMKTHMKAGLTGALKNLVGINGHKEYLPHHIQGSFFAGGDAYCRDNFFAALADDIYDHLWENRNNFGILRRWFQGQLLRAAHYAAKLTGRDQIDSGSWCGNETIWRMVLDLNHAVYFGAQHPDHILNIVDGVIAGEGDGPLSPTPKPLGMIFAGENPAHIDAVLARIMGYNLSRIPMVYQAIYHRKSEFGGTDISDIPVRWIGNACESTTLRQLPSVGFTPPHHWRRALAKLEAPAAEDNERHCCHHCQAE
ncbi:MAG: DUF362 domain-containing protein [Planctomycetaceae bacterium]|nr:DUF362 domain-containing protein [Planctomycetaceae bacterium]